MVYIGIFFAVSARLLPAFSTGVIILFAVLLTFLAAINAIHTKIIAIKSRIITPNAPPAAEKNPIVQLVSSSVCQTVCAEPPYHFILIPPNVKVVTVILSSPFHSIFRLIVLFGFHISFAIVQPSQLSSIPFVQGSLFASFMLAFPLLSALIRISPKESTSPIMAGKNTSPRNSRTVNVSSLSAHFILSLNTKPNVKSGEKIAYAQSLKTRSTSTNTRAIISIPNIKNITAPTSHLWAMAMAVFTALSHVGISSTSCIRNTPYA